MTTKTAKALLLTSTLALAGSAIADVDTNSIADRTIKYPATYPFVPAHVHKIYGDVKRVTEDVDFVKNINDMVSGGLLKAKTSEKPWSASYWPLSKGTIADPFEKSKFSYYVDIKWVNWKGNYKSFKKRKNKVLARINELSEAQLAKLAPSEKYDLLMGDMSFDLTNRLWDYMEKWGSAKENSFITNLIIAGDDSLDLANDYIARNFYKDVEDAFKNSWNLKVTMSAKNALNLVEQGKYSNAADAFDEALEMAKVEEKNYVLVKKNSRIAGWEGICNGWATAAGLVPRPRRSVEIELPNGKKLKFYPSDIRGLVSLYYVNSLIQDPAWIGNDGLPQTQGTVSAGLRCNLKNAKTDIWGRPYDHMDDPFNPRSGRRRDPRCMGVHPATWHMGLVNLIGVQDRSFIVERKVGAAVDNHPMYKYEMKLFNPNTGRSNDGLRKNVEKIDENDQFKQFRHPVAKYIVGVETVMTYMDYFKPRRKDSTSEADDSEVDKKMYYDLELDENYNIVGGQWRAYKTGYAPESSSGGNERGNDNMPDFFWTITKNYKSTGWFDNRTDVEQWTDKTKAPPTTWKQLAIDPVNGYHAFNYQMLVEYGNVSTCQVKNKKTKKIEKVFCEQSYNRPQPFINIINGLVDLAK